MARGRKFDKVTYAKNNIGRISLLMAMTHNSHPALVAAFGLKSPNDFIQDAFDEIEKEVKSRQVIDGKVSFSYKYRSNIAKKVIGQIKKTLVDVFIVNGLITNNNSADIDEMLVVGLNNLDQIEQTKAFKLNVAEALIKVRTTTNVAKNIWKDVITNLNEINECGFIPKHIIDPVDVVKESDRLLQK